MFGNKSEEAEKLVKEGKWDKLSKKFLNGNDEERLAAAKALSTSHADEAYNALIDLLKDSNHEVVMAAVLSLSANATDRAASQLQWLLTKTPATDKALCDAIQAAISNVRGKIR